MKRPVVALLGFAGLFLSAVPPAPPPDVMNLLRTGQLRFKRPGIVGDISDSTDVVRLFGPDYRRSTSWLHASGSGGGSINHSEICFRYERQGIEFILSSSGYLFGIVLTEPYAYAIVDDLRLHRVKYRELHQRYFPADHDSTSINVTTGQRGKRVMESGLMLPDLSYCRGWFICQRRLPARYGSFTNGPFHHPVLEPLIQTAPLVEVYLRQPPDYGRRL